MRQLEKNNKSIVRQVSERKCSHSLILLAAVYCDTDGILSDP